MFKKFPKQFIYTLIILVPFVLLFFNSPFWHNVKLTLMGTATSSVAVARWPVKELEKLLSYHQTWEENQKLKSEKSALKSRMIQLEELMRGNERYEKLSRYRDRNGFSSVTALVVARDPANWNSSLMIDKGKADGIRLGMPVVNADGVVGKVAEVAQNVSKVILVNDPGFSVAAVNRRSRVSGLLSGSLSGKCRMFYLPENADIKEKDEIVTASLSAAFPEGILVGEVTQVFPTGSGPRAEVRPAVEVSKIEEVLVIK
ncbi:MAG: rod shape-determining protein MreC [Candidatus Omnitrophica bacterium]|nr:rod shape-determining protein MreC [Candidatus Omnitrophota bacterium]